MTDYSELIARMRARCNELLQEASDLDIAAAFIEDSIPAPTPPPEPAPEPDPVPTPTPTPTPDPEPPTAYKHPLGVARFGSQTWYLASWAGGDLSRPGWAGDAVEMGLTCLRHMDSNCTNFSTVQHWSERQQDKNALTAYIDGQSKAGTVGISIEEQISLANDIGADLWLTHPLLADDDYFTQCAKLVKERLNPELRVFIELSNEVWNSAFSQFQQAIDKGVAAKMPGSNKWYQAIAWEMSRADAMYEAYDSVFNGDRQRVQRVFCHGGNLDLTAQALKNLAFRPGEIDMLCCAPYVSVNGDGAAETYESWKAQVGLRIDDKDKGLIMPTKRIADKFGIPCVGFYEFGSSHSKNADVFAKSSIAYDCYRYMHDVYMPLINGPACHYTLHGTWTGKSAWGLLDHQGQDIATSGKARAVRERFGK